MSDKVSPFSHALADFGLNLYREIGVDGSKNVFISPLSISFALGMTYAGASGNTKSQLRRVLFGKLSEKNDDEFHALYADVMNLLNKDDENYKLLLANRLYAHQPNLAELSNEFTGVLKTKYGSDLRAVDFGKSEQTRAEINDWVGEKTNQKIRDLIPQGVLSSLTRLVLVNAIYFKGDWKIKFNQDHTNPALFYVDPNKEIQIDMMNMRNKKHGYTENERYQVLGLPYMGDHLAMFIFLPTDRFGLAELEKSLSGKSLVETITQANSGTTKLEHVSIPKFKLEETANLVQVLAKLGATDMFDQNADFSNINGKKDLVVSDVIHKAFVEVNEEGTEAAAATAVSVNLRCAVIPTPSPSFIADHPFLFTIVDTRSTGILFLGRYNGQKN